jgi:hypothetical protein
MFANIIGSKSSTLFNADGFCWIYYNGNSEFIFVTYRLERMPASTDPYDTYFENGTAIYNPNAGYEVYHWKS